MQWGTLRGVFRVETTEGVPITLGEVPVSEVCNGKAMGDGEYRRTFAARTVYKCF